MVHIIIDPSLSAAIEYIFYPPKFVEVSVIFITSKLNVNGL